jgi:hypothetical protein
VNDEGKVAENYERFSISKFSKFWIFQISNERREWKRRRFRFYFFHSTVWKFLHIIETFFYLPSHHTQPLSLSNNLQTINLIGINKILAIITLILSSDETWAWNVWEIRGIFQSFKINHVRCWRIFMLEEVICLSIQPQN